MIMKKLSHHLAALAVLLGVLSIPVYSKLKWKTDWDVFIKPKKDHLDVPPAKTKCLATFESAKTYFEAVSNETHVMFVWPLPDKKMSPLRFSEKTNQLYIKMKGKEVPLVIFDPDPSNKREFPEDLDEFYDNYDSLTEDELAEMEKRNDGIAHNSTNPQPIFPSLQSQKEEELRELIRCRKEQRKQFIHKKRGQSSSERINIVFKDTVAIHPFTHKVALTKRQKQGEPQAINMIEPKSDNPMLVRPPSNEPEVRFAMKMYPKYIEKGWTDILYEACEFTCRHCKKKSLEKGKCEECQNNSWIKNTGIEQLAEAVADQLAPKYLDLSLFGISKPEYKERLVAGITDLENTRGLEDWIRRLKDAETD